MPRVFKEWSCGTSGTGDGLTEAEVLALAVKPDYEAAESDAAGILNKPDLSQSETYNVAKAAASGYVNGVSRILWNGYQYILNTDAVLQAARGNTDTVDQTVLPSAGDGSESADWVRQVIDQTFKPESANAQSGVAVELMNKLDGTATVTTFASALAGDFTGYDKVNTQWHSTQTARGAASYRSNGTTGTPSSGDEGAFFDSTGRGFSLECQRVDDAFFGVKCDGATDDLAAMQLADTFARVNDLPLYQRGDRRTSGTFNYTAHTVITDDVSITKDLSDSEVVRFIGAVGGADGQFKYHYGLITATQSAKPDAVAHVNAHAFVFEDVILSAFGTLKAGQCAYSFSNDEAGAHGLCWGNTWQQLVARGCVQGYMNFEFASVGGHTENLVGVAYFNGKNYADAALMPKESTPILMNNAEGFVFNTLNLEWTEVNGGGDFILLKNESTLVINAFHPEGLTQSTNVDSGIFAVSNSNTDGISTQINVGNMHINNFDITSGVVALVRVSGVSAGRCNVGTISGRASSNSMSDFRIINSGSDYSVSISGGDNVFEYFTGSIKGVMIDDYKPRVFLNGIGDKFSNNLSNPDSIIEAGFADYLRLVGTSTASIATINFDMAPNESSRSLVLYNSTTAPITLVASGNIKSGIGTVLPLSLPVNRMASFVLTSLNSQPHLISCGV